MSQTHYIFSVDGQLVLTVPHELFNSLIVCSVLLSTGLYVLRQLIYLQLAAGPSNEQAE